MNLVLFKRFDDYTNPNKHICLSEIYVDMILTQMITGGSLIGLPWLSEDSELFVDITLSDKAPVMAETLDLEALREKRLELKNNVGRLSLESPQRWPLLQLLKSLESIIENGGTTEWPLYGEFIVEPKPTVVLYCGNIEKDPEPELALEATLVHELYHAWNYCCSDKKARTVSEIDEAFVEYATLCFLDKICVSDNVEFGDWWRPHFREVFEWQLQAVQSKKQGIGLIAAYGFGDYIFKVDAKKELMRVYPYVSGKLPCNDPDVKTIRGLINPFYPENDEKKVLDLIVKVIHDSFIKDQPNKPGISIADFIYPPMNNYNNTNNPITLPPMNQVASNLFWDIIKCPISCPAHCKPIVSIQASKGCWQIPEPWNGSLASDFLIIAGNPALDDAELYPSTNSSSSLSWVGPGVWNNGIVEDFFEGRFGKSTNPAFHGKKYVDVSITTPSILLKTGNIKNAKNRYWEVANKICSLLNGSFVPWSFAFTDIVHCKSSSGLGNPAYNTCRHHTKAIIDLFARMSESSLPTVILIGAPANNQKVFFFGKNPVSCNNHFGSYNYKRGIVYTKNIIEEVFKMGNGRDVRVISGIPAPSTNNCQVSNVRIGSIQIW